jgi:hypothetical protein
MMTPVSVSMLLWMSHADLESERLNHAAQDHEDHDRQIVTRQSIAHKRTRLHAPSIR